MVNLKRMRKKRADRTQAFLRHLAQKKEERNLLGNSRTEDWMIEFHRDILQNIEFSLINEYRKDSSIDDAAIAEALTAAIRGQTPNSTLATVLLLSLHAMRQERDDASDDLWRDGLRTVLRSVRRHSDLRPGRRDYIDFVSPFIL